MGSGRLFRRQKDIPVFIEGEFYCTPKRNVVKRFGVLNGIGEHCIWIGSPSQLIQYLYEILLCQLCFCSNFLYCLSSVSQGQAKVFTLLEGLDSVPEESEVFVVLEGSTLSHVTRAQNDVMLYFIVPGMCVCVWTHFYVCACILLCALCYETFYRKLEMLKIIIV